MHFPAVNFGKDVDEVEETVEEYGGDESTHEAPDCQHQYHPEGEWHLDQHQLHQDVESVAKALDEEGDVVLVSADVLVVDAAEPASQEQHGQEQGSDPVLASLMGELPCDAEDGVGNALIEEDEDGHVGQLLEVLGHYKYNIDGVWKLRESQKRQQATLA